MNFSVGILQIFLKMVQVQILLLMTSSATGILVKRAMTSNETRVSSSGMMERFFKFYG